jgi:hypothetical protein
MPPAQGAADPYQASVDAVPPQPSEHLQRTRNVLVESVTDLKHQRSVAKTALFAKRAAALRIPAKLLIQTGMDDGDSGRIDADETDEIFTGLP